MIADPVKNLVVVRAGMKSLHKQWIAAPRAQRGFDLLICCYAKGVLEKDAIGVRHLYSPGNKIAGYNELIKQNISLLSNYERIAFMDDDISTSHATIAKCFDIGKKENLEIWQPSLAWKSYFTYAGTLQIKGLSFRHVNYVEMMAPFFKLESLLKVRELFELGYESGIDLIWCNLVLPGASGIIDETPVLHTRPVGGQKEENGFIGRRYEDDIQEVLEKYGHAWPSLVARGGKKLDGTYIGRVRVALYALQLFMVASRSPNRKVFKLVADHVRHMATRSFSIRRKSKS
ncbi:MAG: hypothetical protein ACRYGA_05770 [Janthinobacterium lividum]